MNIQEDNIKQKYDVFSHVIKCIFIKCRNAL